MSTYEAWRATHQDAEAAAKAAFEQVQGLAKMVDGLQGALGRQVRFGSEGFLTAIEKLPRYTYNYASEDGKFLLRDEVLAAIASQARQATPTADMGNTTSQPPSATEAGNPASGAQDKMSTTQQPAALRLADKYEAHGFLGDHRFAKAQWCSQAAVELRFQHLVAPPADPMDWPLPCDVTVGHGTMRKGVALRTLVLRMKVLYEMATGQNADEVAARTPEQRAELLSAFQAKIAPQAAQAAVPLPLLVRDIARDLGITVPQACIALKPLGNYSTNSAVTAEMARMLRDHFPAPAHPAKHGLDAQTIKHISALSELVRTPNAEYFADAHNDAVRHLRAMAAQAKQGA